MDKRVIIVAVSLLVVSILVLAVAIPMLSTKSYGRIDRVAPVDGYGDANGDGLVSIWQSAPDLIAVHNFYTEYPNWDVNMDGTVDVGDQVILGNHWGEEGTPHWIKEDINWDGIINILDSAVMGQHWGEAYTSPLSQERLSVLGITFSQTEFERRMDVDGNGIINVADENYIIQYAKGEIDKFPVQESPEVTAEFSYPTIIRANEPAQFTDASSVTVISWLWDFGDGTTSGEQNPMHTFSSTGVYTVTLTVTDSTLSDSVSHDITIYGNTPPVADAGSDRIVFVNEEVVFNAGNSYDPDGTIVEYNWGFGDSISEVTTVPYIKHTYTSTHEPYGYTFTLRVEDNDGLHDSDSAHIRVEENGEYPPTAEFSYTVDGNTVSFTDTSIPRYGDIEAWLWDFGDGTTSGEQNPVHTYIAGEYMVSLTVTNLIGLSDTMTKTISFVGYKLTVTVDGSGSISVIPPSIIVSDSEEITYVSATDVTLTATASSGYVFDRWTGDISTASFVQTASNNPLVIHVDADKSVTAHFTSDTGGYYVTAHSSPVKGGTVSGGGQYNAGDTVILTATSNNGYSFNKWTGYTGGSASTVTFTMPSYDVDMTANFNKDIARPSWGAIAGILGIIGLASIGAVIVFKKR